MKKLLMEMEQISAFLLTSFKDVFVENVHVDHNLFHFKTLKANQCRKPTYHVLEDSFKELPDWAEALFAIANIIIIIFALCGNIGALVVVAHSKLSKWSTKSYFLSLAAFDLLLTIFSPTVDLSQLMSRYRGWILGSFLCKAIPFVQTMAVVGVAGCLVVIAVERYLSVVRAFNPPERSSRWRRYSPKVILLVIWVFGIGSALPNLWYYELVSFWTYIVVNGQLVRPRNETCETTYYLCQRTLFDASNIAYYSALGCAFIILTACFTFCYISILIFVRNHGKFRKAAPNMATRAARNHKTLRLILGLILLYLLCRAPLWAFIVITNTKKTEVTVFTLFVFYGLHVISNIITLVNPFIYAIFNDSIRSNPSIFERGTRGQVSFKKRIGMLCCRRKSVVLDCGDNPPTILDKSLNKYDLTKQNNCVPSISTQKFFISDRSEFQVSPITSELS